MAVASRCSPPSGGGRGVLQSSFDRMCSFLILPYGLEVNHFIILIVSFIHHPTLYARTGDLMRDSRAWGTGVVRSHSHRMATRCCPHPRRAVAPSGQTHRSTHGADRGTRLRCVLQPPCRATDVRVATAVTHRPRAAWPARPDPSCMCLPMREF